MAKDKIGNELHQGDLVLVTLQSNVVFGRVREIKPGGVALIGGTRGPTKQQQVTAGAVIVDLDTQSNFHPDNPTVSDLIKVTDPELADKMGTTTLKV